MEHVLKTQSKFFDLVQTKEKPFEVRRDDRPYALGDTLRLIKYEGDTHLHQECIREITYILGRNEDEKQYVPDGYVVLGLQEPKIITKKTLSQGILDICLEVCLGYESTKLKNDIRSVVELHDISYLVDHLYINYQKLLAGNLLGLQDSVGNQDYIPCKFISITDEYLGIVKLYDPSTQKFFEAWLLSLVFKDSKKGENNVFINCNCCHHINITEEKQRATKDKENHICNKYHKRVFHDSPEKHRLEFICPCDECLADKGQYFKARSLKND